MSCDVGKVTESSAHSPSFQSPHLRHSSFSKPSLALPTSQLILQPFRCFTYVTAHFQPFRRFTYVTAHSTALPLLHLHHRHFTYVTAHSPTLLLLYLCHSSFYIHSIASPTSQVILQPFCCFTYVTGTSRP